MVKLTIVSKPICQRVGCSKYGQLHDKCTAHSRRHGGPCGANPLTNQFVCRSHGGNNKVSKDKAKVIGAIKGAQSLLGARITKHSLEDTTDPISGLLEQFRYSRQIAANLEAIVNEFDKSQLTNTTNARDVKFTPYYTAWVDERKLCASLAKMCIDAGIAKRELELVEAQANQLVAFTQMLLTASDFGLTAEQIINGKIIAARVFREIAARELPNAGVIE
jgi:hypothetical protein